MAVIFTPLNPFMIGLIRSFLFSIQVYFNCIFSSSEYAFWRYDGIFMVSIWCWWEEMANWETFHLLSNSLYIMCSNNSMVVVLLHGFDFVLLPIRSWFSLQQSACTTIVLPKLLIQNYRLLFLYCPFIVIWISSELLTVFFHYIAKWQDGELFSLCFFLLLAVLLVPMMRPYIDFIL